MDEVEEGLGETCGEVSEVRIWRVKENHVH
jgi:hypothetical protein